LELRSGLVFFALPLHPAGKPSIARADQLSAVTNPILFLQGSNDPLAQLDLLEQTVKGLKGRATLHLVADADHAFHAPTRTGRKDPEVPAAALDEAVQWMAGI